jgi:hypothetical protein
MVETAAGIHALALMVENVELCPTHDTYTCLNFVSSFELACVTPS